MVQVLKKAEPGLQGGTESSELPVGSGGSWGHGTATAWPARGSTWPGCLRKRRGTSVYQLTWVGTAAQGKAQGAFWEPFPSSLLSSNYPLQLSVIARYLFIAWRGPVTAVLVPVDAEAHERTHGCSRSLWGAACPRSPSSVQTLPGIASCCSWLPCHKGAAAVSLSATQSLLNVPLTEASHSTVWRKGETACSGGVRDAHWHF